jgi:hypothetical protein
MALLEDINLPDQVGSQLDPSLGTPDISVAAASSKTSLPFLTYPYDILFSTRYGGNYMVIHVNEQENTGYPNQKTVIADTNGNVTEESLPTSQTGKYSTRLGGHSTRKTTTSIALNIPDTVTTNFGVSFAANDIGIIGSAFESFISNNEQGFSSDIKELLTLSGIVAGGEVAGTAANILGNWMSKLGGGKNKFFQSFGSGLGSGLGKDLTQAGKQASQIIGLRGGFAVNPYQELFFERVNYRTFSFTFKMISTRKEESDQIERIINSLKFHMHPEINSKSARFYTLPSEFDIEFYNYGRQNQFLDFITTCVLTDVSVNYAGGGSFLTHGDGSPFAVDLTLKFQETEILTKNRIEELYQKKFNKALVARIAGIKV